LFSFRTIARKKKGTVPLLLQAGKGRGKELEAACRSVLMNMDGKKKIQGVIDGYRNFRRIANKPDNPPSDVWTDEGKRGKRREGVLFYTGDA